MTKRLDDTRALASKGLAGPYRPRLDFDPRDCSPEYSMSKPGFVRETNAGSETNAKAELDKQ